MRNKVKLSVGDTWSYRGTSTWKVTAFGKKYVSLYCLETGFSNPEWPIRRLADVEYWKLVYQNKESAFNNIYERLK